MMIDLVHGEPILFGADNQRGVMMGTTGSCDSSSVADVGLDASWSTTRTDTIRRWRSLSHGSTPTTTPRPRSACSATSSAGVRPAVGDQVMAASEAKGPVTSKTLMRSNGTWHV